MNELYKKYNPKHKPLDLSLFLLLTSDSNCSIEGVRVLTMGTEEWKDHITTLRKQWMDYAYDPAYIEQEIGKLSEQERLFVETSVRGLKYPKLDGCPFKNFLCDPRFNAVANILPEDRQVIILDHHDSTDRSHYNLFYDAIKAKQYGNYQYNGSLYDALKEFRDNSFVIHRARYLTLNDPKRLMVIPREKRFIVTAMNIDLEQFREK